MWLRVASISGLIAVAAGAFGAHALAEKLDARMLDIWKTAAHYQLTHSILLAAMALRGDIAGEAWLRRSAVLITLGIVVFSGSLYALALSGIRGFGAITPLGGVALLGGWLCLALAARGNASISTRNAPNTRDVYDSRDAIDK